MKLNEKLKELDACKEAIEWVGDRDLRTAWEDCERGDWMLWLYEKLYPKKIRERTLAAGYCVNTVRHLMKDKKSRKAVDMAIAYGEGRASKKELDAAGAAWAAGAAAWDAAVAAAWDAAVAAGAARAAGAAGAAAWAAGAAGDAAWAAGAENQKQTADICRKYLTISETIYRRYEGH